jgi:hypothetical protein
MEPENSLPCSQEPAPGSYPEPDEYSSRPDIHQDPNLHFRCTLGLQISFLLSGFPIKRLF